MSLIKHYIEHGNADCTKCQRGFRAYWIGRKP